MGTMAAGKPVIATDVRGSRDLVQDGVNGFLVPVGDIKATAKAIEKLSGDGRFTLLVVFSPNRIITRN